MKAVRMHAVGGPDVLKTEELPEPCLTTPTQLKVRLAAAGINPIDTKLRARGLFVAEALPTILGLDGAGSVEQVGSEVSRFKPGDRVWFCNGGLGREPGNYAQYHIIDQAHAVALPAGVDLVQAAAAPLVLLTAWEALFDRAGLRAGQSVLIHAGAGGVGHVAIQLAKLAGARVITTVSTAEKVDLVRRLGADEIIDYRRPEWTEEVLELTQGRGVDIALDTVGPAVFEASMPLVADYGSLITLLDPGPMDWKPARDRNLRIGFELMLTPLLKDLPEARAHQVEILTKCGAWMRDARLHIEVAQSFPLDQAAQAHALLESGHVAGKLVLDTL